MKPKLQLVELEPPVAGDDDLAVQRGLRSRSYEAGRFSAKRENGVYHFQNLVREFLEG